MTPYTADVQQRIVDNYRSAGHRGRGRAALDIRVNHDFALVEPAHLLALMREVAEARPEAIATFCTNLRAAPLAGAVEAELGIPLLDTVSTTVWGLLRAAGADPAPLRALGPALRNGDERSAPLAARELAHCRDNRA